MSTRGQRRAMEQQAAECVVRSVDGFALHELRESPDADLVDQNDVHVGLEIVQTVDQTYLDVRGRLNEAANVMEAELRARVVRGSFVVYFDLVDMGGDAQSHRAWLRKLPKRMASRFDAIEHDMILERTELESCGISRVARIERALSPETHVALGWRTRTSPGASLAEIVLAKKHERLHHYRKQNGDYFRFYWLAIASLGEGTVEDGGYSMLLNREFETNYDRVLLILRGEDGRFTEALDVTPAGAAR